MKISTKEVPSDEFQPHEITFQLDTPEELATLYHMLNLSVKGADVRASVRSSDIPNIHPNAGIKSKMWGAVNDLAIKCGLKDHI